MLNKGIDELESLKQEYIVSSVYTCKQTFSLNNTFVAEMQTKSKTTL